MLSLTPAVQPVETTHLSRLPSGIDVQRVSPFIPVGHPPAQQDLATLSQMARDTQARSDFEQAQNSVGGPSPSLGEYNAQQLAVQLDGSMDSYQQAMDTLHGQDETLSAMGGH